jgi:hypothetical protein
LLGIRHRVIIACTSGAAAIYDDDGGAPILG